MKPEEIQWALVTGASSGIGEQLSRHLASKGINLILSGRNKKRLEVLKEELSKRVNVKVCVADLSLATERVSLIEALHQYAPELIVNNGGFGLYGDALSYETDNQMQILEVNGNAVLQLTLEGARTLISLGKKGVVVNIASAAAFPIFPRLATYSAAKAFVVKLSESLDEETRPYGVRILVSCPGMVDTNFRVRAGGGSVGMEKKKAGVMDVNVAVDEIWKQIIQEKKISVFNWIYKLSTLFILHFFPKRWVASILKANIDARHPPTPMIKKPIKEKPI